MNNIFIYAFKLFIKYFLKILLLFLITEKIIINYKTLFNIFNFKFFDFNDGKFTNKYRTPKSNNE